MPLIEMSDAKDKQLLDGCKLKRHSIANTCRMSGRNKFTGGIISVLKEQENLLGVKILWKYRWSPADESRSALETYPWIAQTHPSPLPHQPPSLPRPQPDCGAPNRRSQKHRKRGERKVREGVQKPQQSNSKQLEHHLRHQCPTGSVSRDSGRVLLLLLPIDFQNVVGIPVQVQSLSILSVTNKKKEPECGLYVSGRENGNNRHGNTPLC